MLIATERDVVQLPTSSGYVTRNVFIQPSECLNRVTRRGLEASQSAYVALGADPLERFLPGALPEDFHEPTLRWAVERAAFVCIWGAGAPDDRATFAAALKPAIEDGWVLLALVRSEKVDAWFDYLAPWMVRRGLRSLIVGEQQHLRAADIPVAA